MRGNTIATFSESEKAGQASHAIHSFTNACCKSARFYGTVECLPYYCYYGIRSKSQRLSFSFFPSLELLLLPDTPIGDIITTNWLATWNCRRGSPILSFLLFFLSSWISCMPQNVWVFPPSRSLRRTSYMQTWSVIFPPPLSLPFLLSFFYDTMPTKKTICRNAALSPR